MTDLAESRPRADPPPAAPEFWFYLPQLRIPLTRVVERARRAEEAGFDGVGLMDHFAPPGATTTDSYEAMVTATAILARTERLRVGHLVLCSSFRHPSLLAKEVVSLDHLSGGRFELGLGWGSVPGEFERFGLELEDPATRSARLAECLAVVTALFTGEPVTHEGRFYRLRDALQRPRPLGGRVPVTIGGGGPKLTMPLVRSYADWWNCPSYAITKLDELRPLAGPARISTQHPVGLAASPAQVAEVAAVTERRFRAWGGAITGTPETVAARLCDLVDVGVARFYLAFSDFGTDETLERFVAEVAGPVRRHAARADAANPAANPAAGLTSRPAAGER